MNPKAPGDPYRGLFFSSGNRTESVCRVMNTRELSHYLDRYLEIQAFSDASLNGIQVENGGAADRIGLAVDASLEAILTAAQKGCDFLIVHHGLFWGGPVRLVGHVYRRIRALIHGDMALYASHLPLDAHPEVGNNIQIAKRLCLSDPCPFGTVGGSTIGVQGHLEPSLGLEASIGLCTERIGPPKLLLRFGPERIGRVGIVTGSATDHALFAETARKGIDMLITGEPKQEAYNLAQEYGLNIFYGGHYHTETFGLKALGSHLADRLGLEVYFLASPCPL